MKKNVLISILILIVISLISLSYLYYEVKLKPEINKEPKIKEVIKESDILEWDDIKILEFDEEKYILKTKKVVDELKYEITDDKENVILSERTKNTLNINELKVNIFHMSTLYDHDYIIIELNDKTHNYFVIHNKNNKYEKLVNIGSNKLTFTSDSKDNFENYNIIDNTINFLYINNSSKIKFGSESIDNDPCTITYLKLTLNKKEYILEKQNNPYSNIKTNFKCE